MSLTCREFVLALKQRLSARGASGKFERIFRCSHLPNKFFLVTTIGRGLGSTSEMIDDTIDIDRDDYSRATDGVRLCGSYLYVDRFVQLSNNPIISDYENIPVDSYVTGEQAAMFQVPDSCEDPQLVRKLSSFANKAHVQLVHATKYDFVFFNPDGPALQATPNIHDLFAEEGFQRDFEIMNLSLEYSEGRSRPDQLFTIKSMYTGPTRNLIPVYLTSCAQEEHIGNMQVANILASYLTEKEHCTLLKLLQREQATHPCAAVHDLLRKVYPTYDVALVPSQTEPLLSSNS